MLFGFGITYKVDRVLLSLRKRRSNGNSNGSYFIPRGGLFELVSCPHYLGEIIEWTGFSLACDLSLASVSFVLWTCSNLIPRAMTQHSWYHSKFREEYPKYRKAIIPFIV